MKTLLAIALTLAASVANACPPQAFSLGYCAPQAVYQPQPIYAPQPIYYAPSQPVYAPVQQYAPNQPAQITVLPGKLSYTAPQVTYSLEQVQGYPYAPAVYGYAAPATQQNFQGHYQQQNFKRQLNVQYHHAQGLRIQAHNNAVVNSVRGPLGFRTDVQADGDIVRSGPLGRPLRIIKN